MNLSIVIVKTICNAHKVDAKHQIGGAGRVTRLYMLIRNHFIAVFRSEAAAVIVHAATARESTCSLCG